MSKQFLFFDTETTGTNPEIARMVQLAWAIYNDEGRELLKDASLIYPHGFEIPEEATRIHGITTQRALRFGSCLKDVLLPFLSQVVVADLLIAHNISFDLELTKQECKRAGCHKQIDTAVAVITLDSIQKVDTMKQTTNFCKLPGNYGGYKWPRLEELHQILFKNSIEGGAHDALNDVRACAKCFFKLKKKGMLQ